ncbi:MAG: T9SS type A sorting domain-containing protein [Saprospiraceae bacterium]|nr:T9SS type A sorting domain-containing protein [Saprospiraceae bacterium]
MRLSLRYLLFFGWLLPATLAAQVFPVESGSAWRGIVYGLAGPIPVATVMCGDTTINAIKYNKSYQINYGFDGTFYNSFYRACTRVQEQKVWVLANGATEEILLYDFGVDINDTLHLKFLDLDAVIDYYVESIEQIMVDGQPRKKIRFQTSYGIPDIWIEGIGSIMGPLDRGFFVVDAQPGFTCYLKNGDVIFKLEETQPCESGLTCDIISSSGEAPTQAETFKVFPNPADAGIWLKSNVPDAIRLEIFSANGQMISALQFPNGHLAHVATGSLEPGLYLFKIARLPDLLPQQVIKVVVAR